MTEEQAPTIKTRVVPHRSTNAAVQPREYLAADEVERLMTAARTRGGRYGHRDATMILIAYRHGLRAGELVGARWDMLELTHGLFHVRRSKNGRASVHILGDTELCALRQLQREQSLPSSYLFTTERRAPMTVAGFQKLFTRIGVTIRGRPQEACFTRGRERRMLGSG